MIECKRPTPLSAEALTCIDTARVATPSYDRGGVKTGVVHIGPGAFHRAHQADFFDRLLEIDPRWGILGVSLKSRGAVDALAAQDGLYTLAVLDREPSFRVIGSIVQATTALDPVFLETMAAAETKLITLTITEKGYCLGPDGALDLAHAEIAHDLETPEQPVSAIGWLVRGLSLRRASGARAPVVASCDNLPSNGAKLRAAVLAFAGETDRELAKWISGEVRFPCSMVDSITPATDDALRKRVREHAGVVDRWPIQREAFASWVIEDCGPQRFPDLAAVGAVLTHDVEKHERAKLRMLNGSHSALAYLGLARGCESVADAMGDAYLAKFADDLMRLEIAPGLNGPSELDLANYRVSLLERYRNPAIQHRLAQIAWDGSQKLPVRLLPTIAENLDAGRSVERLCLGVAAWMRFVRRMAARGEAIVDPLARELAALGLRCTDEAGHDVALFLGERRVFDAELAEAEPVRAALAAAYREVMAMEADASGGGA